MLTFPEKLVDVLSERHVKDKNIKDIKVVVVADAHKPSQSDDEDNDKDIMPTYPCECCGKGTGWKHDVIDVKSLSEEGQQRNVWQSIYWFMAQHRKKSNSPKLLDQFRSCWKLEPEEMHQLQNPPVAKSLWLDPHHRTNQLDKTLCIVHHYPDEVQSVVWIDQRYKEK